MVHVCQSPAFVSGLQASRWCAPFHPGERTAVFERHARRMADHRSAQKKPWPAPGP